MLTYLLILIVLTYNVNILSVMWKVWVKNSLVYQNKKRFESFFVSNFIKYIYLIFYKTFVKTKCSKNTNTKLFFVKVITRLFMTKKKESLNIFLNSFLNCWILFNKNTKEINPYFYNKIILISFYNFSQVFLVYNKSNFIKSITSYLTKKPSTYSQPRLMTIQLN